MNAVCLVILTFLVVSCAKEGKLDFGSSGTAKSTNNVRVTNVNINNGLLHLNGINLDQVSKVEIDYNGSRRVIARMARNESQWIGSNDSFPAIDLEVDKVYDLFISTAEATSIIPITVSLGPNSVTNSNLQNNSVTNDKILNNTIGLTKLSKTGAASGYVIKFNGSNWVPMPDDTGSGGGGGGSVTAVKKGAGIVGSGATITGSGEIAVNMGYGLNQLLFWDTGKTLNVPDENEIELWWDDSTPATDGGKLLFSHTSDGTSRDQEFQMYIDTGSNLVIRDETNTTDRIVIIPGNNANTPTTKMRLDEYGQLGIGTTAPASELQVHGYSAAGSIITITDTTTGATAGDGLAIGYLTDALIINQENSNR